MVRICKDPYPKPSPYDAHFQRFDFPLSDFQKYAIEAIVAGHHTLVTAHTGSGKTLPAEFALEYFTQQIPKKRVIYTSPIKALSNQKFSEFTQKYPHISFGLLTGDIKVNPDADVLIMTTEILMNTLMKMSMTNPDVQEQPSRQSGSQMHLQFQMDIENELACVIFDEVHYINDADRGQTWEKTILMLPPHIQMVMLSATIDAPERFAKWVQQGKAENKAHDKLEKAEGSLKEVYLASTNKRVVPLSHYGYLTVNEGIIKTIKDKALEKQVRDATHTLIPLQNDRGQFQEAGYRTLQKTVKFFQEKQVVSKKKHVLNNLAKFLKDREMLPAIAFVFSRKQVEQCAADITIPILPDDSKIGYNMRRDCEQIVRKLPNYREYMELPEYQRLVALLENGVGIHHSGMVPILREIVEIMISKKKVYLLFATESFAIGLDCPIKTAIFTDLTKFDGQRERLLMSHEYTQMAGRAGRRGIDTIGHVVHCNNLFDLPSESEYKSVLHGTPQELVSKFRLSYSLFLNQMKYSPRACQTSDFLGFIEKSMLYKELMQTLEKQRTWIESKMREYSLSIIAINHIQTPVDICRVYIAAEDGVKMSANKRRKEYERDMEMMRKDYPNIKKNIETVREIDRLHYDIKQDRDELAYLETYFQDKIEIVMSILIDHGYVSHEDMEYQLTTLGQVASGLVEIHPLVLAKRILQWNWFCNFSVVQMIGLMACFTDVNMKEQEKHTRPCSQDAFIRSKTHELMEDFAMYEKLEQDRCIYTGIQYEDALNYDMTDLAIEWTQCIDELSCKVFIQNTVAGRGISIGDFTKAMLKVSTIAKEMSVIAESHGQVDLLHKLSQVDALILKYVTTSQSLYV